MPTSGPIRPFSPRLEVQTAEGRKRCAESRANRRCVMPGRVQVPSTQHGSVPDELIGATPPAAEAKLPAAQEPAGSKWEKLPAYASHWLIERPRNAVVALQRMPGAEADAPGHTLGALPDRLSA
jgi:hypothetical protein